MSTPSLFPRQVYTVSELARAVRGSLVERFGRVWVAGEVSNLRRPPSGHAYLTLKDSDAQLRAALFRNAARRVPFDLEDGLEVLAWGDLTVYEPRGDLQLVIQELEPRGRGALQLAFEQLRARLEEEGLFDPARKRPIPTHPRRLGLVTSPSGAAVRDVIQVSGQRFPGTPILIAPTRVQGEGADAEIVAALARVASQPDIDCVLLVRGGGSLEDLQAFNSERLARAVRSCPVPVVCGVGHEVDVSIADLAADLRAPTPSAAAALALPDREALAHQLERSRARLRRAVEHRLERASTRLDRAAAALEFQAPAARLAAARERLDRGRRGLRALAEGHVAQRMARLAGVAGRLDALSPLAVLARGYAIARRADDAVVVRAATEVAVGDALGLRLGRGELEVTVTAAHPDARDPSPPAATPGRLRRKPPTRREVAD